MRQSTKTNQLSMQDLQHANYNFLMIQIPSKEWLSAKNEILCVNDKYPIDDSWTVYVTEKVKSSVSYAFKIRRT